MNVPNAIHLVRGACALRHFSLKTEKIYTSWLGRYGTFLKDPRLATWTTEQKMEAFLSRLAKEGISASTQNQAFNAVLFFSREILKRELGPVNSLRARQQGTPRHCPTQEDLRRLLAAVSHIYGESNNPPIHLHAAASPSLRFSAFSAFSAVPSPPGPITKNFQKKSPPSGNFVFLTILTI